jgi:hypothetical protein
VFSFFLILHPLLQLPPHLLFLFILPIFSSLYLPLLLPHRLQYSDSHCTLRV